MKITDISTETLSELLLCDAESGRLFWKPRTQKYFDTLRGFMPWNGKHAGKEAFTCLNSGGYKQGSIFTIKVTAHRVIWAMAYGYWTDEIDHINGDKTDNRLANLRSVTRSQNSKNHPLSSSNTSGVTGVYYCGRTGKWRATVFSNGKRYHLGRYSSFDDAVEARKAAELLHDFHPNHGRSKNLQSSFSNP